MGDNRYRASTLTSKSARSSRNALAEEKRGMPPDPRAFLKKCLFIAVVIIVAGIYLTAFARKAEDKADPHTRSFTEFSSVFNERMAAQGIAVGEDTQWDTSTTRRSQSFVSLASDRRSMKRNGTICRTAIFI